LAEKTIAKIVDITKLNEKKTLSLNPIPNYGKKQRRNEKKKAVEK
jgi:hypothetical protein